MERESVLTARSPAIEQSMTDMALDSARTQIEELRTAAATPAIIEADRTLITARADEFTQRVDELERVHTMKVRLIIIAATAIGAIGAAIALVIRRRRAAKIHTPPDA
jgi:Na+-translocating ferredoxin:NAD+ oxidoreductase RnfC subunit